MSVVEQAARDRDECSNYLRDIIRIPSFSGEEKEVCARIESEMKRLAFDRAWLDDYGNVIGQIGSGPVRLVYDAHIDTVGIGRADSWSYDPFQGKTENGFLYGRGASDNKASHAVQLYGAALFKRQYPELTKRFSVFVVGSIQEEDCDGLGLRFALEHSIQNANFVCIGEATNLDVYRGHRGRMEINVVARGRSCHGSAPERGDNAVYKMMRLVGDVEELNERLAEDSFLGKGTCAVTHISCETPSLCAVPDGCRIHIDRRLTHGENRDLAVSQIRELPGFDAQSMKIEVLRYDRPSYRGKSLVTDKYYPTWTLAETHPLTIAAVSAATEALGRKPGIGRWIFSTNGVASMGQLGIPSIGYGPGSEEDAHTTNDRVKVDDLVPALAFYAALPAHLIT